MKIHILVCSADFAHKLAISKKVTIRSFRLFSVTAQLLDHCENGIVLGTRMEMLMLETIIIAETNGDRFRFHIISAKRSYRVEPSFAHFALPSLFP